MENVDIKTVREMNMSGNENVVADKNFKGVSDTIDVRADIVMADAMKQKEKRDELIADTFKEIEKPIEELVNETASEESRTRIKVKDRKELAGLIKEAKSKNQKYRVSRSLEEGFRYDFEILDTVPVAKTMNEEYDDETIDYKGIKIGVLDTSIGTLYEVRYNKNKGDWPEYKKLENAKKYIDILLTKGVEAADASWKIDEDKVETKDSKIEKVPPELLLNLNDWFQDKLYIEKEYNVKIDNVASNQGLTIYGTKENLKKLAKDYNIKQKISEKYDTEIENPTNCVFIEGTHESYGADDLADRTATVGELIEILENYDEDLKVFIRNDNGYTFGSINSDTIALGAYNADGYSELLENSHKPSDEETVHEEVNEEEFDESLKDNSTTIKTIQELEKELDEAREFNPTEVEGTVGSLFNTDKVRGIIDANAYDLSKLKTELLKVLQDAVKDKVYAKHVSDLKKAMMIVQKARSLPQLFSTITTYMTAIKTTDKDKQLKKELVTEDIEELSYEITEPSGTVEEAIRRIVESSKDEWADVDFVIPALSEEGFDMTKEEIVDIAQNRLGLTARVVTTKGWPYPVIITTKTVEELESDPVFRQEYLGDNIEEKSEFEDHIWGE